MEQKEPTSNPHSWIKKSVEESMKLGIKIVDKSKDNPKTFVHILKKH